MRLRILRRYHGWRGFQACDGAILAGRGYEVAQVVALRRPETVATAPATCCSRLLGRFRLPAQALRLGLNNGWRTPDGGLVAIMKRRLLRQEPGETQFRIVDCLRIGNKPAFNGLCVTPDGVVYYGEYALNPQREEPIRLYRSDDSGRSYGCIHEFAAGRVRHIHFVQWDKHGRCLWMGTGDRDGESMILRSPDGERWDVVGRGSQLWRSLGLAYLPDAVYWGNDAGGPDAGRDPAWIVRLDRRTSRLDRVQELQGPCHGVSSLSDGTLLVSTGCEGGQNERDGQAHLWASRDGGRTWHDLFRWAKDPWPYAIQSGVIHFVHDQDHDSRVWFTTLGLAGGGQCLCVGVIEDEAQVNRIW